MTFTYTEDLSVDRDFVRFHTGDTDSSASFLSDAIIASLVTVEGSPQKAVIAAIQYIITKLSTPNFKADWLEVDNKSARDGYIKLLAEKQAAFSTKRFTGRAGHVYRADSDRDSEPTYPESSNTLDSWS